MNKHSNTVLMITTGVFLLVRRFVGRQLAVRISSRLFPKKQDSTETHFHPSSVTSYHPPRRPALVAASFQWAPAGRIQATDAPRGPNGPMKGPTKARKAKTETKTWTQLACGSLRGDEASLRLAGTRTL